MSNSPFNWADVTFPQLDRQNPYLRLQQVTIFVRDQDRSKDFYLNRLGFSIAYESSLQTGEHWVAVAPPDGTAILALVTPEPDSEEAKLIGGHSQVVFLTENIDAKFEDWSRLGVRFHHPPVVPSWGGRFTVFEDIDGNTFALVGFDQATRELEAQRRAIAEKLESERRTAQELEIAKQVQAGLFPRLCRP